MSEEEAIISSRRPPPLQDVHALFAALYRVAQNIRSTTSILAKDGSTLDSNFLTGERDTFLALDSRIMRWYLAYLWQQLPDRRTEVLEQCQNIQPTNTLQATVWLEDPTIQDSLAEVRALLQQQTHLSTEAFAHLVQMVAEIKMAFTSSSTITAAQVERAFYGRLLDAFAVEFLLLEEETPKIFGEVLKKYKDSAPES